MNRPQLAAVIAALSALVSMAAAQDETVQAGALAQMPVREVSVFKDGHAFVRHSGRLAVDKSGNVVMDYLPTPVLGAFWPQCSEKGAKLAGVTAGQRRLVVTNSALTMRELIEGNTGREAIITETSSQTGYPATILGFTERSAAEQEMNAPPNTGPRLPVKGNVLLLRTDEGTRAISIDQVRDVTFKGDPARSCATEEFRDVLTLRLDWRGGEPGKDAEVGLLYLQKGMRWIPNYKVSIDGAGVAHVELQATLINELTDMRDVTCNLVIGVPTFTFKDKVDPMGLQQTLAQLSPYFRESNARDYSNMIMTQQARSSRSYPGSAPSGAAPPADLGPEVTGSEGAEDLFVFRVEHVTLKKGERMVMPVTEFTIPYKDVYTLDLPFAPPVEVWRDFNTQQQAELASMLAQPRVMHKLRLENTGKCPLTTAPALIVLNGQLLAQSLMTYTPIGAKTDLPVTAAMDVAAGKSDTETGRLADAMTFDGSNFMRVDLAGIISLANHKNQPVQLEVVRYVLGNLAEADHDGKVEMINAFEDPGFVAVGGAPTWWGWSHWPTWWRQVNGVGKASWKLTLDPGQDVDLGYTWSYYWHR